MVYVSHKFHCLFVPMAMPTFVDVYYSLLWVQCAPFSLMGAALWFGWVWPHDHIACVRFAWRLLLLCSQLRRYDRRDRYHYIVAYLVSGKGGCVHFEQHAVTFTSTPPSSLPAVPYTGPVARAAQCETRCWGTCTRNIAGASHRATLKPAGFARRG